MQKLSVKYGCMLLCGKLEPATDNASGAMLTKLVLEALYMDAPEEREMAFSALPGVFMSPGSGV